MSYLTLLDNSNIQFMLYVTDGDESDHLYVIELNHTEMATEEDKKHKIDTWAKLFKATTSLLNLVLFILL